MAQLHSRGCSKSVYFSPALFKSNFAYEKNDKESYYLILRFNFGSFISVY